MGEWLFAVGYFGIVASEVLRVKKKMKGDFGL
jgi:hypothetical protein